MFSQMLKIGPLLHEFSALKLSELKYLITIMCCSYVICLCFQRFNFYSEDQIITLHAWRKIHYHSAM